VSLHSLLLMCATRFTCFICHNSFCPSCLVWRQRRISMCDIIQSNF
jgi:hypothetical protein